MRVTIKSFWAKVTVACTVACLAVTAVGCQSGPSADSSIRDLTAPDLTAPSVMALTISDGDKDGVADDKDQCPQTKPHFVVDDRGCHITDDMKREFQAELRVFFDQNSSIIEDEYLNYNESRMTIDEMANLMRSHSNSLLKIEGNMSVVEALNEPILSEQRALSVATQLVSNYRIDPSRIIMVDCKANQPIAPNGLEGIKFNQRVYGNLQKQNESWNRQSIMDMAKANQRCELISDKNDQK